MIAFGQRDICTFQSVMEEAQMIQVMVTWKEAMVRILPKILLGSILRIDVDNTEEYGIPADNPFVGIDGFDEIYAFGLRNPYRFSFDPEGNVIAADAGQELTKK